MQVGAYCLMPNHFHLLLQEKATVGITTFMHKVATAYTMYFNIKRDRVGGLFLKPFRSRHVAEEYYFRHVAQYIHLNPVELFEPGWKEGRVKHYEDVENQLKRYTYSSLPDYESEKRPQSSVIAPEAFNLISEGLPPLVNVLADAAEYYKTLENIKASP
ncbi:MAG: transposase [Minisyncoccia bacterium]